MNTPKEAGRRSREILGGGRRQSGKYHSASAKHGKRQPHSIYNSLKLFYLTGLYLKFCMNS